MSGFFKIRGSSFYLNITQNFNFNRARIVKKIKTVNISISNDASNDKRTIKVKPKTFQIFQNGKF